MEDAEDALKLMLIQITKAIADVNYLVELLVGLDQGKNVVIMSQVYIQNQVRANLAPVNSQVVMNVILILMEYLDVRGASVTSIGFLSEQHQSVLLSALMSTLALRLVTILTIIIILLLSL